VSRSYQVVNFFFILPTATGLILEEEGGAAEPVILEDTDGGDRPFSCPRCGRRYKRKNNAG
jgi:hypothetical protein